MHLISRRSALAVVLILCVALSPGVYGLPVGYTATIIPGKAYDINDKGQVVGEYNGQAYLWTDLDKDLAVDTGEMESLGVLSPRTSSVARGLNNNGQVVGNSGNWAFVWDKTNGMKALPAHSSSGHGYTAPTIRDDGVIVGSAGRGQEGGDEAVKWIDEDGNGRYALSEVTELKAHGSSIYAYAEDINRRGQIVGGGGGAWMARPGSLRPNSLPYLVTRSYGYAWGINDLGESCGESRAADGSSRAVLWTDPDNDGWPDRITNLGKFAGTTSSVARDLNDSTQVVGSCLWPHAAFVWEEGEMYDLNTLVPDGMPTLHEAYAINEIGQIVGVTGSRGFLLTPIPEPGTLCLLGMGALALLRWRRHPQRIQG